MSSIMRWRSGLMAVSGIEGSCREVEGPNPLILKTGPSPVIVCPSAGDHPQAMAQARAQHPPARADSFFGTRQTLTILPQSWGKRTFTRPRLKAQIDPTRTPQRLSHKLRSWPKPDRPLSEL